MGLRDKMKNAKNTSWVSEGISQAEIKSIIEMARISAKIEECRIDMNMTQTEFAHYMGVSQGMISKWESREYNFTIKSLNEICEKLNLELFVEINKPHDKNDYKVVSWNENRTSKNVKSNSKFRWLHSDRIKEAIA